VAVALDAPAGYTLERLAAAIHDRGHFSCGVEALDTFLRTQASQDQNRHTTACYVLLETDALPPRPIVGYVSLANAVIPLTELPPALKKQVGRHDNLPALLLGRMAVDSRHKGKRLGEFLLKHALKTACAISEVSGCFAVLVDAKDEGAKSFYLKCGFEPLPDNPLRLFIKVATVKKSL
jgi:GNAT superfamily N-acetyltransferase